MSKRFPEQSDNTHGSKNPGTHKRAKKMKVRAERRAVRKDIETPAYYNRFNGYET